MSVEPTSPANIQPRLQAKHDASKPLPSITADDKEKGFSKRKITAIVVVSVVGVIIATTAGVAISFTRSS